jgi:hypothetical protein
MPLSQIMVPNSTGNRSATSALILASETTTLPRCTQVKWTGRGDQQDLARNIEEEIGSMEGAMG